MVSARIIKRFAIYILNFLYLNDFASFKVASAAVLKVSSLTLAPLKIFSTPNLRQGLCATLPNAMRASLIIPLLISSAVATETKAKA